LPALPPNDLVNFTPELNNHKNTHDVGIVAYRRLRQGGGKIITAGGEKFDELTPSVVTVTGNGVITVSVVFSSITFYDDVRVKPTAKHIRTTSVTLLSNQ